MNSPMIYCVREHHHAKELGEVKQGSRSDRGREGPASATLRGWYQAADRSVLLRISLIDSSCAYEIQSAQTFPGTLRTTARITKHDFKTGGEAKRWRLVVLSVGRRQRLANVHGRWM